MVLPAVPVVSREPTISRRIKIEGRVQGVFFRDSIRRLALSLGVSGWVQNLQDGSVEAQLEGPPDAVAKVVDFCHKGPPASRVEVVTVVESEPSDRSGFSILR